MKIILIVHLKKPLSIAPINPMNISSHYEANKDGYAIAHVDPHHWMSRYGKDMIWFRSEVSKLLNIDDTIYRVQVGAYRNKIYAEAMLEKLKKAGFQGFIVQYKP